MPSHQCLSTLQLELGRLKFKLLTSGIRISDDARHYLRDCGRKMPVRMRSGVSSGIDLILPENIYVNTAVNEPFCSDSPYVLGVNLQDGLAITDCEQMRSWPIHIQPRPQFYDRETSANKSMSKVGPICCDRISIGITSDCVLWPKQLRCGFCTVGINATNEETGASIPEILEVIDASIRDEVLPAKHILIGGGTPRGRDRGAVFAAELTKAIRKQHNIPIYVMLLPPEDLQYIDMLRGEGVDEIAFNIEFFDEKSSHLIPGKQKLIGKKRYLESLEYSVRLFGPINTRSILVVGVEAVEASLAGVEYLSMRGIMPILSLFRPLVGSQLEHLRGFTGDQYFDLFEEASKISMKYGLPLGPTCIPCQNNTLALPFGHKAYRFY